MFGGRLAVSRAGRLGHEFGEGLLVLCPTHEASRHDARATGPYPDIRMRGKSGVGRRSALKNQIGYLDSEVNAHGCEMNVYMIHA